MAELQLIGASVLAIGLAESLAIREERRPGTTERPRVSPRAYSPLDGFDLHACFDAGDVATLPEVATAISRHVDERGVPRSYRDAYHAQRISLVARFRGVSARYCNSSGCTDAPAGWGETPVVPGHCLQRVARGWIELVERVVPLAGGAENVMQARQLGARTFVDIASAMGKGAHMTAGPVGEARVAAQMLEVIAAAGNLEGAELEAQCRTAWAHIRTISLRLQAATGLFSPPTSLGELGTDIVEGSGDAAMGLAGFVGGLAGGVAGNALGGFLLSNVGALAVVGGVAYLVWRRR